MLHTMSASPFSFSLVSVETKTHGYANVYLDFILFSELTLFSAGIFIYQTMTITVSQKYDITVQEFKKIKKEKQKNSGHADT